MNLQSTLDDSPIVRSLRRWLGSTESLLTPPFRSTSVFVYESTETLQQSTLDWIRLAYRTDLDAGQIISGHAREHGIFRRKLLNRFATRLRSGMSLVDAVEQTPGVVSTEDVLAIRFGQQNGTLGPTLDRLCSRPDAAIDPALGAVRRTLRYLRFMSVVLLLFLLFAVNWLYPVYRELIRDMTGQPDIPNALQASELTTSLGWIEWLIDANGLLSLLCLSTIVMTTVLITRPGMQFLSALMDRITGFVGQRQSVLDLLADAVSNGRPAIAAVSSLARHHHQPQTRRSLLFARNEMDHGVSAWDSLKVSGVLHERERDSLTVLNAGEDAWLIRRLAQGDRDRRLEQRTRLAGVVHLAVILSLALIVGALACLTFMTLTGLVRALA